MRSIDQRIDHLKNQILDRLTQKGILNELQSRFLSNVAQFIQTTDYDVFKPHRERRHTPEYEIAEIIVAQYLKTKNMIHTLESSTYELKINEKEIDPDSEKSSQIVSKIKIENNGLWIRQILNDWNQNKDVLIKQNKEYNRKVFEDRLHQIDGEPNAMIKEQINEDSKLPATSAGKAIIELDPIWVINEYDIENKNDYVQKNIQEEEEIDYEDNVSHNEIQENPTWIIDSFKTPNAANHSSGFVSDDDEPPSLFSKQKNNTDENCELEIHKNLTSQSELKSNVKESSISQNSVSIAKNTQYSNNSLNTNAKNESNDQDIAVNHDLEIENKKEPENALEEVISDDQNETTQNEKETLLSDDFDEPKKTVKTNISQDEIDDFDDFDDFDQDTIKPNSKSKQSLPKTSNSTKKDQKQAKISLSESDIDFDMSNNSEPNQETKSTKLSNDKISNQISDLDIDISSGSFDESNKPIIHKQTKKNDNSYSIDFDIDFTDESPEKTVKVNKKEQKNLNKNENKSNNLSDIEFYSDS